MAMTKKTPVSATWAAVTAAFVTIVMIFISTDPIGNNFDQDRYYTLDFIFPAVIVLLAVIILQHWISTRALISAFMIFEIVVLFFYGGIALAFATWNGDNVIYIAAYMEVYYGYILDALIAGILPLLYLASLQRVSALKQIHATGDFMLAILRDVAWAVGLALAILLLAEHVALGIAFLVLGAAMGVSAVIDVVGMPRTPEIPSSNGPEAPYIAATAMQSSSKVKNVFLAGIVTFFAIGAGFLWPDNFIKPLSHPIFYPVNPRLILDWNVTALIVLEVGVLLGLTMFKGALQRLDKIHDGEKLFGVATIATLALTWGLMLLGQPILPISVTVALIPWSIVFLWAWLASIAARRRRESPGLFGTLFIGLGLGMWTGLVLSSDPGIDGILYLITGVLGLLFILIILIIAVINPRFVNGRDDPPRKRDPVSRESSMERAMIAGFKKHHAAFAIVALVLLAVPPAFLVNTAATSSSNFQLLANVNNDCIFFLADSTTRIDQNYAPNFGASTYSNPNNTIAINMAKNEYQDVQIVIHPLYVKHYSLYDVSFTGFNLTTSPGISIRKTNFQVFRDEYVEALSNIVPDMLVNFSMFAVADGSNAPIWLQFYVPANAMAGNYNGTVTFKIDNKTPDPTDFVNYTLVNFQIKLHVFNFGLPAIPTLKSLLGYSGANFNATMRLFQQYRMMYWTNVPQPTCTIDATGHVATLDTTVFEAYVNRYHGYGMHTFVFYWTWPYSVIPALENGFVVNGINYTSSNYTAYSTSPTYNLTLASYIHAFEAYLKGKVYYDNGLGKAVSWFDELYCYGYDEVDSAPASTIASTIKTYNWLKHTLNMTLPILQTMGGNDALAQAIDIPCFHNSGHEPAFIQEFRSHYPEVWLYSTRGPRFPNPSIATSGFQLQVRALAWECFIYNYSHYLIWDTATQSNGGQGYGYQGWNGGSLLYNVPGGYAPSARMVAFRDGFQDHDYFTLLQHAPQSSQRDALLARVYGLMSGFQPTMDYKAFDQLRSDIGMFLSA
ncbi:MAG TPA: hypothetical protein VKM55_13915 [Candidatus Lokiarchaeia archaeon]|nr:hypothetical protein [Candidatus Lokiarchaeia archaeon]